MVPDLEGKTQGDEKFQEIMGYIQLADQMTATAIKLIKMAQGQAEAIPELTDNQREALIARIKIARDSVPAW